VKTYFLEGLPDADEARRVLSARLPQWVEPWLLNDDAGDAIAYFQLGRDDDGTIAIQADLSGRHWDRAEKVVNLLRDLQAILGGLVTDDDDNILSGDGS